MTMSRLGFDNRFGRIPATYGQQRGVGNGYVIPVIPKTDFNFDGRYPSGTPQEIPVATGIDTSAFVSGVIAVRVHAKTVWPTNVVLDVLVQNVMLTPEEPDLLFVNATNLVSGGIQVPSALITPAFYVAALGVMGPMVRVVVKFTQGAAYSTVQTISLGIDLIGRPA